MLSFCPLKYIYKFFHFFSVIVDSVAQLLASGTVGDREINGYYSLVIVVIALLGKKEKERRQQSGLEMKRRDNRQTI